MGKVASDYSTLSWQGKNHDKVTIGRGPHSEKEIAEYEKQIELLIREIAAKVEKDCLDKKNSEP